MVEKAQNEFDFQSFVYSLEDLAPDEILRRVEGEIKKTSTPPFQDLIKKFIKDLEKKIREMGYERKMRRLRSFLETGGLPPKMTAKEQEAYHFILPVLEARGWLGGEPVNRNSLFELTRFSQKHTLAA